MSERIIKPTGLVPHPKWEPSTEQPQPPIIRPGSGIAVIGAFVELIRKRFTVENGLPWIWNSDIKQSTIAIESAFNEDKSSRNFRPAIYCDIDDQVLGRTVLGDRAAQNLKTGKETFWALRTTPLLIECIAAKKSESASIGDVLSSFLFASSDLIQAAYGFHEMTPLTLSRVQPSARDKDQWNCAVTFSVQYQVMWSSQKTAPLLQEIVATIAASGFESATEYWEEIALKPTES